LAVCVPSVALSVSACETVTVEITSPTKGATLPTNQASIVFSVSGAPAQIRTTCQLDAAPAAPCASPHTYTGLVDGPHTVTVSATTPSGGNTSATVRFAVVTGAGARAKQVTAGDNHTCALLLDGRVRCWGNAAFGKLGYGNTTPVAPDEFPATRGDVDVGGEVVQIAAGREHTCALLATGTVRCWGDGSLGQLGYGNTANIGDNELPSTAGDVSVGGPVAQIATGQYHTCALLRTGNVRCWGDGTHGRLGYGNTNTIGDDELPSSAGDVNVGGAVAQIAAGGAHSCARLSTGAVRCWGWPHYLGYGDLQTIGDDEVPASAGDVNVGSPVVEIATGGTHTCARLPTGAVKCWGGQRNPRTGQTYSDGQLGYGNTEWLQSPAGDVSVGGQVLQVSPGLVHTCALLSTQNVRCWGRSLFGQLGYGNTASIGDDELPSSAGDVNVGGPVVQLAAGGLHTCALLSSGSIRCWGQGDFGQLGYYGLQNVGDDELPSTAGDVPLAP
jgi:alpha-tubulin suppressor-like RCC1 family protein